MILYNYGVLQSFKLYLYIANQLYQQPIALDTKCL